MRALVRVLVDAAPASSPELAIATYRIPSPKNQAVVTISAMQVTIEGGLGPGATPDQISVPSKATAGPDLVIQSDPFLQSGEVRSRGSSGISSRSAVTGPRLPKAPACACCASRGFNKGLVDWFIK